MADSTPVKSKSRTVGRGAHWIEWLTGGICTLLVAAMIGWISYHAVVSSGGAPQLSVQILRQQPAPGGGYEVSFTIENKGARTAASVPVKGNVVEGGTVIETQEITFDYARLSPPRQAPCFSKSIHQPTRSTFARRAIPIRDGHR